MPKEIAMPESDMMLDEMPRYFINYKRKEDRERQRDHE